LSIQQRLEAALETAKERGKTYDVQGRPGHEFNGQAMAALFPGGVLLKTPEDFTRFILLVMTTTKVARYAANFAKGGHADSAHDLGVYAFLLEDFDADHHRL
jgi:hypothetical protein